MTFPGFGTPSQSGTVNILVVPPPVDLSELASVTLTAKPSSGRRPLNVTFTVTPTFETLKCTPFFLAGSTSSGEGSGS